MGTNNKFRQDVIVNCRRQRGEVMKRILCSAVCLIFVLLPCLMFAADDAAQLEKNRLQSDIQRLKKQQYNGPDPAKHQDWVNHAVSQKEKSIKDLQSNPQQYFYDKEERKSRQTQMGISNSRSHRRA